MTGNDIENTMFALYVVIIVILGCMLFWPKDSNKMTTDSAQLLTLDEYIELRNQQTIPPIFNQSRPEYEYGICRNPTIVYVLPGGMEMVVNE